MTYALADLDHALTNFVSTCASALPFNTHPEWLDRPVANSSTERPLWVNRRAILLGATELLEIGIGGGSNAVAALGIVPRLRYFGVADGSTPLARSVTHQLTQMYPGQVQVQIGDMSRVVPSLRRNVAGSFDRIRINAGNNALECHAYLLEALRFCDNDSLILVERCDITFVNEAVMALLADGTVRCATLPGWGHVPEQILLQIKPAAASPTLGEELRIILVAIFGDSYQREWEISRPSVAAYARKVGAELIECRGDLPPMQRSLAKLVALDRLETEGRVLLLDTDIVIRDNAPDLFEIVPTTAAGLFLEGQVINRAEALRTALTYHDCTARKPFYGNTAVFMLPKALVKRFALSSAQKMIYVDLFYEQGYFNALLHNLDFPIFNLSPLFNCMPVVTPEWREQSFFIHFAGGSLGVLQPKSWTDVQDEQSLVTLRMELDVKATAVRVFDIRNEMRLRSGVVDRLIPATHLLSRGLLLSRQDCFALCCPASNELLVWGPYLELPPGSYAMEVLLSELAFHRAFLDGLEEPSTTIFRVNGQLFSVPPRIAFDITRDTGLVTLVPRTEVDVRNGSARLSFTLADAAAGVEIHLYGCGVPFDVYGLRVLAERLSA